MSGAEPGSGPAGGAEPDGGASAAELRDLIAGIAAGHADPAAGELPGAWATLVELGLPLVGIDAASGGSGGTLGDLVVLVRALGRHAVSTPLIEASVASWVLAAAGPPAAGPPGTAGPPRTGLATITLGTLHAVPWARHAGRLVWYRDDDAPVLADLSPPARAAAAGTDPDPASSVTPGANVAGEPRDDVRLGAAPPAVLRGAPPAGAVRARLGLLRAAALTGAIEGAYELTRGYVSTREQFGRPLVRLPAVATGLATIKTELIQSDAALARATELSQGAGGPGHDDRGLAAVAAARVMAGRAATRTARLAHQLHGAIGVTREYPLHRFSTRLWAWRDAEVSEHDWAVLLGGLAAAGGEAAFWDDLTG